jgi:maleylpyruvate isomerase
MIDHGRDLVQLRAANERLLDAVATLDNAATAAPSRLPGWSRGHVLAHLARNADALVNVLEGRPMYPDAASREADIERDAPRSPADHLADLRQATARFERVAAVPADWTRVVELRNGMTDTASRVPFRRWAEVELHHVDLGIGHDLEDLSEEFVGREIEFLTERFAGDPSVPALRLAAPGGQIWLTGRTEGAVRSLTGPAPELMGWLSGRRTGAALDSPGAHLPVLPPL